MRISFSYAEEEGKMKGERKHRKGEEGIREEIAKKGNAKRRRRRIWHRIRAGQAGEEDTTRGTNQKGSKGSDAGACLMLQRHKQQEHTFSLFSVR